MILRRKIIEYKLIMANEKKSYLMTFDTTLKQNPTKLLVVKNLKQKPLLPDNYQEQTWKKLSEAVIAIQTKTPIQYTLEELYQTVENVCNNNLAASLYTNLVEIIDKHVKTTYDKYFTGPRSSSTIFLIILDFYWSLHCDQMLMICNIFLYLDQTYILKNPKIQSIWNVGLNFFHHHILLDKTVQNRAVEGILVIIEKERNGEMVDKKLLRSMLRMISDFKMYEDIFEEKFIRASESIYATESLQLINKLEVSKYLHHIQKRLNEEYNRSLLYLEKSTKWPIIRIVEKYLIKNHISSILQKCLEQLLNENRLDELKLLFVLLTRLKEGLTEICKHFNAYIKKYGQAIIIDPENDKNMIQDLLNFKEKIDECINICFESNITIVKSSKEVFESLLGQRINIPAMLIAKFINSKLNIGIKGSTEDLEKLFDKIIVIFRLINGKDVFEAFYKKYLAKRLLLGTSISIDAEKIILSKLKQECGGGFTFKLEEMFKDMLISKDINVDYKQYLELVNDLKLSGIDMMVNIVSMGNWPTFPVIDVIIPNEIIQYQQCFNKFYLAKHKGRKLQWQPTFGHCILRSYFKKGTKELQVSLFQAVVLLLFNECKMLPFKEIKTKTNINDLELKRILKSLACGKVRVLIKKPNGQIINNNDNFSINDNFFHKLYRIKINQVQIIETYNEQKLTEERVYHDRNYQIEAALVRIMKIRKSLLYTNLMSELYQHLKFPVKLVDIKNRIESLIDRQYIERDKDNINLYNYIL